MFTRQFFAQNVMRSQGGGIAQRTPEWILIEDTTGTNSIKVTSCNLNLMGISLMDHPIQSVKGHPNMVAIYFPSSELTENIDSVDISFTVGGVPYSCISDCLDGNGDSVFPIDVLINYGIHLQLVQTAYGIMLYNTDSVYCNGEIIASFGFVRHSSTMGMIDDSVNPLWTNLQTPYDIAIANVGLETTGYKFTNGESIGLGSTIYDWSAFIRDKQNGAGRIRLGTTYSEAELDFGLSKVVDNGLVEWTLTEAIPEEENAEPVVFTIGLMPLDSGLENYIAVIPRIKTLV